MGALLGGALIAGALCVTGCDEPDPWVSVVVSSGEARTPTAPGETDKKKFSKEGQWGDMPDKQQAEAKNLINRNFPSHYRQAIETYFKKLANRTAPPQK